MHTRAMNGLLRTTVGALDEVDLINRTIDVLVGPVRLTFDVPPPCDIALNGERVKLHVLQPGDTLAVIHGPGSADCSAIRIDVRSHVAGRRGKTPAAVS